MSTLYEFGSSGRPNRHERDECTLRVYPGSIAEDTIYCPVLARRDTSAADVIQMLIGKLSLERGKCYVLAEVREFGGEEWVLTPGDFPAQRMFLWPRAALDEQGNAVRSREDYRFLLREKNVDGSIRYEGPLHSWLRVTEERRLMVERGLLPASTTQDYDDLCALPDLNERSLLDNLRVRFKQEKIYTYIGAILIAMNPFKFLPIYNPKYVQLYDNHRLGTLQPHVFAVADAAYHTMLRRRINQCIVISGESGSGKTQSTNFLIHHLTALSQKGYASGVEQIILGAGPVLEAFGNAKTAHNNNSSRFGKFIQVNYWENGIVRGAIVEKYLLEKSRLVSQEHNERNYHVFYYLLCGTSKQEREELCLLEPEAYLYLNQMKKKEPESCFSCDATDGYVEEEEDLRHDFKRLQLAMEMVGFLPATRKQIFSLLSAVLHLGNIAYKRRPYREEATEVENPEMLKVLSELLQVKEEMLMEALTTRKAVTVGEKLILPYKLNEAVTARDSMAKSLYSALFDWIVLRINHALMNKMERVHNVKWLSIGVLDIFGFEDFENNSFEQFCINYANECLHYYFNQHVFKIEQEEYQREGINWNTIDYIDNTGCINLISKKPTGLFHLLDEECNFPQATNETLLAKFKRQNMANEYYEITAIMEPAFIIRHYAGKVKYMIKDFREKNGDHMRPDIVVVLRSSRSSFMRSLVSIDPVALFRWAVLRAVFRASFAFRSAATQAKHKAGLISEANHGHVTSYSFLRHPVHQRSLEILQRCKEDSDSTQPKGQISGPNVKQRRSSGRTQHNFSSVDLCQEVMQRTNESCDGKMEIRPQSGVQGPAWRAGLDDTAVFAFPAHSRLMDRVSGILMKNRASKPKHHVPKHLLDVKSLKHMVSLTLQDCTTKSLLHVNKKKKPPSISAQFQTSLSKLLETLNQAEPYFIRCIRSNAEKLPLRFDERVVRRQLHYTGMLQTVRIRQTGYSARYTLQEFVEHFRLLLPRRSGKLRDDVVDLLKRTGLDPQSYQLGRTKVFLREAERQRLLEKLHAEVLRCIVLLQRWCRMCLDRKRFLHARSAAICIQRCWRNKLLVSNIIQLQAACKGSLQRSRCKEMLLQRSMWKNMVRVDKDPSEYQTNDENAELAKDKQQPLSQNGGSPCSDVNSSMLNSTEKLIKNDSVDYSEQLFISSGVEEPPEAQSSDGVTRQERPRSLLLDSEKARAKRQNNRQRELDQAAYSLEYRRQRSGNSCPSPTGDLAIVKEPSPFAVSPQNDVSKISDFEGVISDSKSYFGNEGPLADVPKAKLRTTGGSSNVTGRNLQLSPGVSNAELKLSTTEQEDSATGDFLQSPSKEETVGELSPTGGSQEDNMSSLSDFDSLEPSETKAEGDALSPDSDIANRGEVFSNNSKQRILQQLDESSHAVQERQQWRHLEHQYDCQNIVAVVRMQKNQLTRVRLNLQRRQEELLAPQENTFLQRRINDDGFFYQGGKSLAHSQPVSMERLPGTGAGSMGHLPLVGECLACADGQDECVQNSRTIQRSHSARVSSTSDPRGPPFQSNSWLFHQTEQLGGTTRPNRYGKPLRKKGFLHASETRLADIEDREQVDDQCSTPPVSPPLSPIGVKFDEDKRSYTARKRRLGMTRSNFLVQKSQDMPSDEEDHTFPPQMQGTKMKAEAPHEIWGVPVEWDEGFQVVTPASVTRTQTKGQDRSRWKIFGSKRSSEKKAGKENMPVDIDCEEPGQIQMEMDVGSRIDLGENRASGSTHHEDGKDRNVKENAGPSVHASTTGRVARKKSIKISSVHSTSTQSKQSSTKVLTSLMDLDNMMSFVLNKISELEPDKIEPAVELFMEALKEFHNNMVETYVRVVTYHEDISLRYKDLMLNFEHILDKTVSASKHVHKKGSITNVSINLFCGFLDEFVRAKALDDRSMQKIQEVNGHQFKSTQFNIPSFCEECGTRIWMMEGGYVCKLCKLTCHKKCYLQTTKRCPKYYNSNRKGGAGDGSGKQFAVELSQLVGSDRAVPLLLEKLLNHVEMHGLYTEGIYRKSGANTKVKELRSALDSDINNVSLDDYQVHVIGSVIKQWLRELPSPLLTDELYDEFLRTVVLPEKKDKIKGLYSVIEHLPPSNHSTLERLIFHLVRIAQHGETNRMSPNALAIVFAPCILRSPANMDPLQSVKDIAQTTHCVELLINEQMRKFKARIQDISTLKSVENSASQRLSLIRTSIGKGKHRRQRVPEGLRVLGGLADLSPLEVGDQQAEADENSEQDMSEIEAAFVEEEVQLSKEYDNIQKRKEEIAQSVVILDNTSDEDTLDSLSRDTVDPDQEFHHKDLQESRWAYFKRNIRDKRKKKGPCAQESTDSDGSELIADSSVPEYRPHTRKRDRGPSFFAPYQNASRTTFKPPKENEDKR
uniref:unconventional myosin-IXa isoform X3 n=1 Tax=Myxine glutinosa TaxID=7769 RepID=UPI00358F878E